MEDDYRVCNYKLNHHDVVQLFIVTKKIEIMKNISKIEQSKDLIDNFAADLQENQFNEVTNLWYRVGDDVDCLDQAYGAWFEAIILKILSNNGTIIYRVQWKFLADDEPFDVVENMIRPRALTRLTASEIITGQRVMINYNTEEPSEYGYWYDFTVENIKKTRWGIQLIGTIHIGRYASIISNH